MPTFEDPKQDADELGEAARGLAHATRHITHPPDTYETLGALHYALTSVQQSLNQLASWHHSHSAHAATDDGNRQAGWEHAEKASGWLRLAGASLDHVVSLVMRAQTENGRIAWHPEPVAPAPDRDPGMAEALREREAALDPEPPASGDGPAVPPSMTR
ncbi:hypothetical protein JD276_14585 [Leucobacter sp. CSA1]|uniref:Uncharacterized protein n=1 Tax=Leucobacter chromiisoli TaxID=2796471 RepID=A0A934UWG9_9MICO|nr:MULTISPECIES: hypothetical protein [Microbacteriaceae]MBK0420258.1 hypothetical protein [Leucobacter chromiisoli]MCD1572364.1 hypothetical protein [Agromyces mediolanus]